MYITPGADIRVDVGIWLELTWTTIPLGVKATHPLGSVTGSVLVPRMLLDNGGDGEVQFSVNPPGGTHIGYSAPLTVPLPSESRKYQFPPEKNNKEAALL